MEPVIYPAIFSRWAADCGFIKTKAAGNMVKVRIKATPVPMAIIMPKSITGRIPLTISEPKATMVVIVV